MMKQYIDDVNAFLEALRKCVRFIDGKLQWSRDWEVSDHKSRKSTARLTPEVFETIANTIFPRFQFKLYILENHTNNRVPILDIAC